IVQPDHPNLDPAQLCDYFILIVPPTIYSNRHFLSYSAGGYPRILILKRALFMSAEHLEEEISGAERIGVPHVFGPYPATETIKAIGSNADYLAQPRPLSGVPAKVFEAHGGVPLFQHRPIDRDHVAERPCHSEAFKTPAGVI